MVYFQLLDDGCKARWRGRGSGRAAELVGSGIPGAGRWPRSTCPVGAEWGKVTGAATRHIRSHSDGGGAGTERIGTAQVGIGA